MGSCVVLCDDLTGSSVQSILLKDRGLQVRQIIRLDGGELPLPSDGEALVVNCDTRRRPRDEALSIVRRVLRSLPGETRVGKRIDTTLRGHLAAETDAILAARPRATALVVPAYPASGRTTVGGYQLLDGVLIERTEVSKDPSWPIGESFVPAFFGGDRAVALLPMERVRGGPEAIAAELERFMGTGHRIVVADAMTDQDIESVAAGACMVDGEIVPVDPGPMTAAFFSRLGSGADSGGLVLVVVGTLSEWTRSQVAYLNGRTETVEYTLSPDDDDAIPAAFGELLARRDRPKAVILRTPATLRKGAGGDMTLPLASVAERVLRLMGDDARGVFLSGGDTAVAFFLRTRTTALAPEVEIQPLLMGGRILDGDFAGLKVATKGGLVGEEDGVYQAVRWLQKKEERP